MRVAIYSRKSKFTGKGDSVENQVEICRDYINSHFQKPHNIAVFEDEGFSGKNLDRPQFTKLLEEQSAKPFDIVIVYRLDRISRKVGDFTNLIEKFSAAGTDFVSVKENFDTSNPTGRAMMNISAVFAQLERETIAERIKDNMYLMAKDGHWTGGTTPLGYKSEQVICDYGGRTKSHYKLTVDETEASLVQLIYDLYLQEQSCKAVEAYLVNKGYRTRKNCYFDDTGIKRILTNPVYCAVDENSVAYFRERKCEVCIENIREGVGFVAYNRTDQSRNLQPYDKWLITQGMHEPLIDSYKWLKVQNTLKANSEQYEQYVPKVSRTSNPISLLTGVMFCSCGATMYPRRHRKGEAPFSYVCSNRDRSRNKLCNVKNCNGLKADEVVRNLILESETDENIIAKNLRKIKASAETVTSHKDKLSDNIQRQIAEKQRAVDNFIATISSGKVSGSALDYINEKLNTALAELDELRQKLSENDQETSNQNALRSVKDISEALRTLRERFDDIPIGQRRNLVKRVVEKVVWNGENLDIFDFGT